VYGTFAGDLLSIDFLSSFLVVSVTCMCRYRLYGQWKHDARTSHPRLIRAYTDILEKAKYIMK